MKPDENYPDDLAPSERGGYDPTIQDHADKASDDPPYEQGCFWWLAVLAVGFVVVVAAIAGMAWLSTRTM